MYEHLTVEVVESLRKSLGLTAEQFSLRIGYSNRAYFNAANRGVLSKWMKKEIAMRFGKKLSEMMASTGK